MLYPSEQEALHFTFQWIKPVNLCLVFLKHKHRKKIIRREFHYTKGDL